MKAVYLELSLTVNFVLHSLNVLTWRWFYVISGLLAENDGTISETLKNENLKCKV